MRKSFLPLAMAFAMTLLVGSIAKAQLIEDDFDDITVDDASDDDGSPAVPEPSAAFAMGAGLATIAFALRRRR